ncbi:MAG: GatB/YqeY domain-containing protein [Pseudomonadota bacterium]
MLRAQLNDALKEAMKARDQRTVSTVRLILAALKDRDIAARAKGVTDGIGEEEIVEMLHKMVRQRREAIELYEQGGRLELAQQEQEEIAVIERFLPKQMSEAEMMAAVAEAVSKVGAATLKDMGKVMGELKQRYAGRMDFAKAGQLVKQKLAS